MNFSPLRTAFLFTAVLCMPSSATAGETADWPYTEGSAGGGRFSELRDIDRDNVQQLQVAWTYRHGDFRKGPFPYAINKGTAFESTPIVVDGRLIFTTPYNRVIALDPERGTELWTYDPKIDRSRFFGNMMGKHPVECIYAGWRGGGTTVRCRTGEQGVVVRGRLGRGRCCLGYWGGSQRWGRSSGSRSSGQPAARRV